MGDAFCGKACRASAPHDTLMPYLTKLKYMEETKIVGGKQMEVKDSKSFKVVKKIADLMDVSIQMISNLELGKKAIRPENLVKVCVILGVSADYILCLNEK